MTTIQAIVLGLVQGLTEFLPVSSSGHLYLAEKLFGISAEGEGMLLLGVLLHLGTLLAVCIVYFKRLIEMLRHPIRGELKWLILATIPAVIAALAIDFDEAFEGKFIIWSFYLTSLVLVLTGIMHKFHHKRRDLHRHIHWYDALVMGLMQAVAILPGLSRSGSTICGGVTTGLSRRRAADFAFLMSVPAILGSAVLEGKDLLEVGVSSAVPAGTIVIAVLAAAISGFIAIKGMLLLIRKVSPNWFAVYTFLIGTFCLLDRYVIHQFGL